MLKDEIQTRKKISAEVKMIRRNQVVEETTILEEIRKNKTKEQEVCKELEKKDSQSYKENGIVYIDGRIYILNNQKIRERILQENHKPVDVGHPRQQRIMELIKWNYWWPEIKTDVKKYVQGCFKSQQNKVQHIKKAGELHPLKIPEGPWKEISINIIGPLPKSNRKDAIIVIVD